MVIQVKGNLSQKIFGINFFAILLTLVPVMIFQINDKRLQIERQFQENIKVKTSSIVKALELPMWNFANDEIRSIAQNAIANEFIEKIEIYQSDEIKALNVSSQQFDPTRHYTLELSPVHHEDKKIGSVKIYFNSSLNTYELRKYVFQEFLIVLCAFIFLLFISNQLIKKILINPIRRLKKFAQDIGNNKVEKSINWTSQDELGDLATEMTKMLDRINSSSQEATNANKTLHELNANLQNLVEQKTLQVIQSAKLASLGEMAASVAHEINNPLTLVSGYLQILKKIKDDEKKFDEKIDILVKSTERIQKIVLGLKKFSRSSNGSMHQTENIKSIINESFVIMELKSKRFDVKLSSELSCEIPLQCDAVEIEQVFINLISNSIDAIKDLPERWIKITGNIENEQAILRVIDSGHQISKEIEDKLFLPFFTTKAVGEGTGLGLSIVKGILENHQATIRLNRDFKNTCFEMVFNRIDTTKGTIKKAV